MPLEMARAGSESWVGSVGVSLTVGAVRAKLMEQIGSHPEPLDGRGEGKRAQRGLPAFL